VTIDPKAAKKILRAFMQKNLDKKIKLKNEYKKNHFEKYFIFKLIYYPHDPKSNAVPFKKSAIPLPVFGISKTGS
jgi:hypothetical protein